MSNNVIVTEQDTLVTSVPTPHPDYPGWDKGHTAPRLFQRLGDWTPGYFPPASADEPLSVSTERLEVNRELWGAIQSWERQQEKLDQRAKDIARDSALAAQQKAERQQAEEQVTEDQRKAAEAHAARLRNLHVDAADHGFTVAVNERDGKERIRLAAPPGHVSLGSMYPWEDQPLQVRTNAGVLVSRADEGIEQVEQFVEDWPDSSSTR